MKDSVKPISITILISIIIVYFCSIINSSSIFNYLDDNLITILLAFLAINTATLGHLAAKIQDIMVIHKELEFESTIKEMKKSLIEQIIMISISLFLIIIQKSDLQFNLKTEILNVVSLATFIFALNVLWDTGKSVFVIIDEIKKIKK